MEELNYLEQYYNNYDEENRLLHRYGQVEYITTMKYIHKLLVDWDKDSSNILEVGAGTGRYSVSLAHEGYRVSAVEYLIGTSHHTLDMRRK